MGTSSSYGGPTGTSALLPPWAQPNGDVPDGSDGDPNQPDDNGAGQTNGDSPKPAEPPTPIHTNFRSAKGSMTRFAGSGDGRAARRAARAYVRSRGGARGAATAATAGRAATGRLAGFLANVVNAGAETATRMVGLARIIGENADTAFAAIANALAPSGATLEEAAARKAVNEALCILYTKYDLEDGDLGKLDALDADTVAEALRASVVGYVYHRWLEELGRRIEQRAVTPHEAVQLEKQIRDLVTEAVKLDFSTVDPLNVDWNGAEGRRIVERIYQEAYAVLEAS